MIRLGLTGVVVLGMALRTPALVAEDGHAGWLRYAPIAHRELYRGLPSHIVMVGNSPTERVAGIELQTGLSHLLGRAFTLEAAPAETSPGEVAIVLRDVSSLKDFHPDDPAERVAGEAFVIRSAGGDGPGGLTVTGGTPQALLYGVFHLLEEVGTGKPIPAREKQNPAAPIRWVQQWDNLDGSIERGYAGRSIFFDGGHVRADLARVGEYGRLLASIGINGITVNNVNADLRTLEPEMLQELARIAAALRPWGIRMSLSVDLSSPQAVGKLPTFDPLDPDVAAWWKARTEDIYRLIPDFAGFVVKADSEGRPGPSQYHRTPAEAANVLARALQAHGGMVLYRGFVYNHHLDFHDMKADRARAGYDNFAGLDGKFESNVVIQVKHGPIDFQVREPVSPLFAALRHTPQAVELQTSQEYTGQQRHMVFLVPMWKTALDTDLRAEGRTTPLKEIVEGKTFHQETGGFVSVVNVGLEANWLHHPMAMANLYGFGKLAWNPDASSEEIVDGWTRLTFGNDPRVVGTVNALQLGSWHAYEQYTGPFGIGTLTDIIGVHFGPGVGSAENNGWGQWFRADRGGVGMDRTTATGTGYIGQYPEELARRYEDLKTCPEDLLLFLHHVPYTHRMANGITLIQAFYDAHFEGAAMAATYAARWQSLQGLIDEERYAEVLRLFEYQAGHAVVWRDAVKEWFRRESGIAGTSPRKKPLRIEAEAMTAVGYRPVDIVPPETASGGKAMACAAQPCSLTTTITAGGEYRMAVQYFDLRDGVSRFELLLNGKLIATWKADDILPPATVDTHLDGHTSTRFVTAELRVKAGDVLMVRAAPDQGEQAPVDYIELLAREGN